MLLENQPLNDLTGSILAAAIEVHRILGPGLLESTYQSCLGYELSARNLRFVVQQPVAIVYKRLRVESAYRVDLVVEDKVAVEVKAVETYAPLQRSQLLTYVRLAGKQAGLLINFNVERLMDGVKRVINTVPRSTVHTEATD
jgi:GxxExxY protein